MHSIYKLIITALIISFVACGRRGALLTPEGLAPQGVNNATIVGQVLQWEAPTYDIDGRKLKSMRGYSIAAEVQPGIYQDVDFIVDTRHAKLEALRASKREQGQSAHAVKLQESDKVFTYKTSKAAISYKITPIAQNGSEGAAVIVGK